MVLPEPSPAAKPRPRPGPLQPHFRFGRPPAESPRAMPTVDSLAAWQTPAPPGETGSPSSPRLPCPSSRRKQISSDGLHNAPKGWNAAPKLPPDYAPHQAQAPGMMAPPVLVLANLSSARRVPG